MKVRSILFKFWFFIFVLGFFTVKAEVRVALQFKFLPDFFERASYCYTPKINLEEDLKSLPPDSLFNPYKKATFSEGLANGTHWFKISLSNISFDKRDLVFALSNNELDLVKAFKKQDNKIDLLGTEGDLLNFFERPTQGLPLAIPFSLKQNESAEFFLAIQKNNRYVSSRIDLLDYDFWQDSTSSKHLLLGVWFGGLIFYLLTSFLLALALKQPMYWYYFGYVFFTLLFMLTKESVLWKFVYPAFPEANDVLASRFSQLALGFFALFAARFLLVDWVSKNVKLLLEILAFSMFLFVGLTSLDHFFSMDAATPILIPAFFICLVVYVLILFGIGLFLAVFKQSGNAIVFSIAFVLMLITVLATALGFFNANFQIIGVQNGLYAALLIEITILSFYLVYRLNRVQDEKIFYQQALGNERQQNINYLIEGQERERSRIGREIHDALGSHFSILLQLIRSKQEPQKLEEEVAAISNTIRDISYEMMPRVLVESGLELAIKSSIQKLQQQDNRDYIFYANQWPKNLSNFIINNLYRIYQEALNNAIKHAKFQEFSVQLIGDEDEFLMQIDDDGVGFYQNNNQNGLGLRNMQTRAEAIGANFYLDSSPEGGTTIMVKLPKIK